MLLLTFLKILNKIFAQLKFFTYLCCIKFKTMTIQEQIRQDLSTAIAERNSELTNFLKSVVGEYGRQVKKELSDAESITLLKWMHGNAEVMGNEFEMNYLSQFLPKKLNEEETNVIIEKIIADNGVTSIKEMGKIMSALKQYPGIDNALASKLIKERLS